MTSPLPGTIVTNLPIAISLDGSEDVPIVQGGTTKRTTVGAIANTATGFVPTSRTIITPVSGGLTGGGALTADLTLQWSAVDLTAKSAMAVADAFAINDATFDTPAKVTFPNAMKAISGLTALAIPNLLNDYLIINRASDGLTYKINPSSLGLAAGNVPAGGTTAQVLAKASNTNYDTTWSNVALTLDALSISANPTGSTAQSTSVTLGSTLAFSGTSLRTAAITGDVTASANSFATTLASSISGAKAFTTSLAIGGATIGSYNLAVAGVASFGSTSSTQLTVDATSSPIISAYFSAGLRGSLSFANGSGGDVLLQAVTNSGSIFLIPVSGGAIRLGTGDAAAPVAQTIKVQSVVAGTAATSGQNWTLIGSLPTGTGTSGDIIFQTGVKTGSGTTQGTATTALTIKGETQQIVLTGDILLPNSGRISRQSGAGGLVFDSSNNVTQALGGFIVTAGSLTLGANASTLGSIKLFGSTSGDVTIKPAAVAGTATVFQLPADNGTNNYVLTTNGSGVTSWAAASGTGTVTQIIAGTGLTGGTITTTGTIALDLTRANTWTGALTLSGVPLITSGNFSAAAWTTAGVREKLAAASYTDTSSSGTVAAAYTDFHGAGTILASSSTTYTNYFGAYYQDPVASTNVTMTNKWSVGADSLKVGTSNPLTISTAGVLTATSPVFTTPNVGVASGTSLAATGVLSSGANGGTGGQLTLSGATSGSAAIKVAAAAGTGTIFQLPADNGTNNYVLTTNGSGVTSWAAAAGSGTVTSVDVSGGTTGLTSSGGPVTGSGTITLAGTLIVANGGTGRTTLTNHGVLIGAGTSAITQLAAAAAGTLLGGVASSDPAFTATPVLGVAGTTVGTLGFQNATSGTITLSPPTGALGTVTLTLPAATDTLVGKATTDTLTNKTLTSPTLTTPVLGTPSSGTLTNCTGLPVAGGGTGVASLTAYAVICGGTTTTGAVQSIAGVGTSGQVLTSNGAGALPTFQAASAAALSSKTGSFTRDPSAANGNVAITGVGFIPTSISFTASATSTTGTTAYMWQSTGFVDSSKAGRAQAAGLMAIDDGATAPVSDSVTGAKAIYITAGGNASSISSVNDSATVNSFDSDGFTLAWVKAGSPTSTSITVNYICYK